MNEVLARFSAARVIAAALIVFGATAASLIFAVKILANSAALAPRIRVFFFVPLGLSGAIVLGRVLILMLRRVSQSHASALWLEGDRLVYLDKKLFCVKVSDIACVTLERRGFWPLKVTAIVVRTKDGTSKGISGVLLDEPPTNTVEKLNDLILRQR